MPLTQILESNTINEWRGLINASIIQANALGAPGSIAITGGTINGTVIGGTTPAAATFTTLTVQSGLNLSGVTITLDDNAISGNKISGGTIDNIMVELSADPTNTNHATTKSYVDAQDTEIQGQIIAFSIVFGG